MSYYGYAGTILYVDLNNNRIRKEPTDGELLRDYLGGMGLASKILYDLVPVGADPLSPENVLVYSGGPFVGTLIPGCSRGSVMSKSPQSGFIGESGTGGSIAIMLRYAGYDALVISGRSSKPVYLVINDSDVRVEDASDIWGLGTFEATDILHEKLPEHWISCIGPAGENMVRSACIIENKSGMVSRGGLGAVAGSKNLKAIAVRGTKGISIFDKKQFRKTVNEIRNKVSKGMLVPIWRQGDIIDFYMGEFLKRGVYLTNNFREGVADGTATYFTSSEYKTLKIQNSACVSCPVGCRGVLKVPDGRYKGLTIKLSNPWASPMSFNLCGILEWDEAIKCVEMCNYYGIDAFNTANIIAFLIELYEKGFISESDTDGIALKYGDVNVILALINKIGRREGFGILIGEGFQKVYEEFGEETKKYANEIKGMSPMMDLRESIFTENFSQLTDPRGGHHARGWSVTYIPRKIDSLKRYATRIGAPDDAIERIFQQDTVNIPRLLKWVEDFNSMLFSFGFCMRPQISSFFDLDTLKRLYYITTGFDASEKDLLIAGERIWNIQKEFNTLAGATKENDMPPYRMMNEPVKIGDKINPPVDENIIKTLLHEYYEECGWDSDGRPKKEKLAELGIVTNS